MDARTEPGQVTSLSHQQAQPIVLGMLLPVFMGSQSVIGLSPNDAGLSPTMLVATFGAIVAASVAAGTGASGGTLGGPLDHAAVEAFRRVFFGVTGTLAIVLIAILLLEEKPLQTGAEPAEE